MKNNQNPKKHFSYYFQKKIRVEVLEHKQDFFCWKEIKMFVKKILMKYTGQCVVIFLDHTNIPSFHLSSLDSSSTPEKNPKMCQIFFFESSKIV